MGHNRDLGYVKAFGKHLKKLGLAKSLSQEELSYKCGFALSQTGQFERGERNPTLNTIKILARGLDEEPSKLLEFKWERGRLLLLLQDPLKQRHLLPFRLQERLV